MVKFKIFAIRGPSTIRCQRAGVLRWYWKWTEFLIHLMAPFSVVCRILPYVSHALQMLCRGISSYFIHLPLNETDAHSLWVVVVIYNNVEVFFMLLYKYNLIWVVITNLSCFSKLFISHIYLRKYYILLFLIFVSRNLKIYCKLSMKKSEELD